MRLRNGSQIKEINSCIELSTLPFITFEILSRGNEEALSINLGELSQNGRLLVANSMMDKARISKSWSSGFL